MKNKYLIILFINILHYYNMEFNILLDKVYKELGVNECDTVIIPVPEIEKTTTRIIWKNIKAFLKITRTPPDHLVDFLIKETGKRINWYSESKSDGLIIHNVKTSISDITNLMKKYVSIYVLCSICNKSDTLLAKDPEIKKFRIKCNACNSQYTI